jgi:hypothetical protein
MWEKSGDDWIRSDGVKVKYSLHGRVPYTVTGPGGLPLSQPHELGRNSQPIKFQSAESAMKAADERWPPRMEA